MFCELHECDDGDDGGGFGVDDDDVDDGGGDEVDCGLVCCRAMWRVRKAETFEHLTATM